MFRNKKRLFSLILALVMVLGISVTAFADTIVDDTVPTDFGLTVAGADVSYMAVTVEGDDEGVYPDVTTYTAYIEFPSNSNADLSKVEILATFNSNLYTLSVDGTPYVANMEVDFSDGYVDFKLKNRFTGKEYKNYMVNAGIEGTNTPIIVTIDLKNAKDWLGGNHTTPGTGYVVPTAAANPNAEARVQSAVDGLESGLLTVALSANIGDSAMDVFADAVEFLDLNVVGIDSGYVSEIGGLGDATLPDLLFQKTEPSKFPPQDWDKDRTGWIYLMDGIVADVGASQYTITASDETLTWGYTFDWGVDLGGTEW